MQERELIDVLKYWILPCSLHKIICLRKVLLPFGCSTIFVIQGLLRQVLVPCPLVAVLNDLE